MDALPGGTVTFLFTDIEGSTRLMQRLGDRYGELVSEHRRLLRGAFAAGHEMDTQGDAFFYSFDRAGDAAAAAVAGQRSLAAHEWADGVDVRVRMGLHTGEPSVGDEGYVGVDVVRAARLCSAAHGGQVLVSEATRALLGSRLPEGVEAADLGEHHLKDLEHPERVYQLTIGGLPSRFPALRTLDTSPGRPPMDLERSGADLGAAITARVLRQVEDSLADVGEASPARATKRTLVGLGPAVLLAAAVIVIILLARALL